MPIREAFEAIKKENYELGRIKEELMERVVGVERENEEMRVGLEHAGNVNMELNEAVE